MNFVCLIEYFTNNCSFNFKLLIFENEHQSNVLHKADSPSVRGNAGN